LCRVRLCYDGPVASGCQNRRFPIIGWSPASASTCRRRFSAAIRACPLRRFGSIRHRRADPCSPPVALLRLGDRPGRHASLEVSSPSANKARPRCPCCHAPDDPAATLSAISRGLALPKPSGNATRPCGISRADHAAPGSFVAPYRYPPLRPAMPQPVEASLMGLHPSQCCSCPQGARCFHRAGPTCRFASVHPSRRVFVAGRSTAYCHLAPT